MYNKIIELPISYYSEKERRYHGTYAWDVNEVQNLFSILELVIKEPLLLFFALGTMFIIKHKTDFICFDFHANFGMDHFEISQEP
jgi:hypothetical protein